MTTRSGLSYRSPEMSITGGDGGEGHREGAKKATTDVSELVRLLLEDRRVREEELGRERARREAAKTSHSKQVKEQLEIMRAIMDRTASHDSHPSEERTVSNDKLTLTRYVEGNDIEAFLTTFEHLMTIYHIEEDRWVAKLAPHLAGRAQQAYTAMSATDALVYAEVKKAILQIYDINEETYRQRFRAARRKEGELYIELATRMTNLFRKWTADCSTTEAMAEKLVIEQLLDTMPVELCIWLSEKKPTTGREAGKLADDYQLARRRSFRESGGRIHESHHQGATLNQPRKCYSCGQQGHLSHNCPARPSEGRPENTPPASTNTPKEITPKTNPERKCYNCHKRGHFANRCHNNALYCGTVGERGHVGGRGISGVGVEEVGSGVEEGGGQSGRGGWAEVGEGLQGDRSGGGSGGGYGGDSSGGGVGGVFDMGTEDDRGREVAQVVVGTEDDRWHEVAQVAIGSGRADGPLRGGVSATRSGTV